MKLYKMMAVAGMCLLTACGHKTETTSENKQTETPAISTMVSVTTRQMQMASIEIGTVEMKNLTTALSVNGTLVVPNQNKALVTSLISGTLRTLNVQPGAFVHKGQIIGSIANTELSSMQQQLISVNAQAEFLEKEVQRQRELVAGNAAPLKSLQKAEAELHGVTAQRDALKKQLAVVGISSSGTISSILPLTAPISGSIAEINAQIGSAISANVPIAQITNNSDLHLDLFVYEKDLSNVAAGQTIHFTLTNSPGKEYDAVVYAIGTAFVNESKAVPVHARVINDKKGLIEGMSVTARISLGDKVYPAIPNDAIANDGGKDYIFVVKEGGAQASAGDSTITFERVEIIRGTSDVGYTEIKPVKDLLGGTRIATSGAFFLMAKMTNTEEDE